LIEEEIREKGTGGGYTGAVPLKKCILRELG
jgi:hypothetical protein